jgi:hypothetical protein
VTILRRKKGSSTGGDEKATMTRFKLLLLMPVMLTWAVPLYAEVYQDEKGVWRQTSYTEAPAWKPPIETSDDAYEEYIKAETTGEKVRLYRQYRELFEREAEERRNANNEREAEERRNANDQEYKERMQAIAAEYQQRWKENLINADEQAIEWDLKYDRKIRIVGRQPVELKSRLLKKGYREEAINRVINKQ